MHHGCQSQGARRVLARQHFAQEVNNTIQALNSMYGCVPNEKRALALEDHLFGTASIQWDSLAHIEKMVQQMGKPSDMTCRGALRSLQAASGYMGDQPVGSLASFNLEAVSLPTPGWKPIDLADIRGSNGQQRVNEFVSSELLPPEIAKTRLEALGLKRPYSDPLLRPTRKDLPSVSAPPGGQQPD